MGQGSKAGRQLAYKNIAPTVISTIGTTSDVLGDRPSAIAHLSALYYAAAAKKVQQIRRKM
jgi:hypothetical protein